MKESRVSEDAVKLAMIGNFPDDPAFKEHLFCMSKKVGLQNDAGEIQMNEVRSKISKYVDDPALAEKLENCAKQKDTPQQTAFEVAKCTYEASFGLA